MKKWHYRFSYAYVSIWIVISEIYVTPCEWKAKIPKYEGYY